MSASVGRPLASVVAALMLVTTATMQTQRPVRDVRHEASGAGVISGVVVEDADGTRALRRASVQLASEALMTSRQFYTRDDGSFTFDGLPPGQYALSAGRSGYMNVEYGAQRQGGKGSAIVLTAGQRATGIVLKLSRYAAIIGVIYDQNGEAAPGISVEAMRYTMRTGRRTLSSVYGRPSFTDDRGVYRLAGLLPGDYYVAAGPSPDRGPTDIQVLTSVDVERVLQLIAAPGSPVPDATFEQPHQAFAPVFFPGATTLAAAQVITLRQSEERAGVDIRLQLVPTARVDGTVSAADGRPVGDLQVFALPLGETSSLDLFSPSVIAPVTTDAQGRFTFPAIVPGRYTISVKSGATRIAAVQSAPPALVAAWAMADVAVAGADSTVALTLQSGATVSGRVVFKGDSAPNANTTGVRVVLQNLDRPISAFFSDPVSISSLFVDAGGAFLGAGVPPGRYRLTTSIAPAGWTLRSALVNGVDTLDAPVTIRPGQTIDDATIVFTDKPTELSGTLQTPTGAPTADYFIIVFAADKSLWTPSARRNVMARPTSVGRYEIKGLPPGEYLVVAVTDVEQGDWWNPAFLERLVPAAAKITLSEGESKALDLKIGGAPTAPQIARRAGPCPCPVEPRTSAGTVRASGWPLGR